MIKKKMEITHKKTESGEGWAKYEIIYRLTEMTWKRKILFEFTRSSNTWYLVRIRQNQAIPREVLLKIESILRGLNS